VRTLAFIQAVYFAVTGIWPLLHIRSFIAVTGPKTDLWLVRTVGLLIVVIALGIGAGAWHGAELSPQTPLLAIGSAVALAGVDVVYVTHGVISRVYLLDAVAEVALIVAWIVLLMMVV
jgi:hypothetical protein